MSNQEYNELNATDMLYTRESLMMNITEDILVAMEDKNISKAKLAKLLDKSKAFITQMLGGSRNMTLRSLSDIAFALDMEVSIKLIPKKSINCACNNETQWEGTNILKFADKKTINKTAFIDEYECRTWKRA